MEKPTSTPPNQAILDRVIYGIFVNLLETNEFNDLVDKNCKDVTGVSSPALRAIVKEAFRVKVGI